MRKRGGRVGQVHQDQPADHRVDRFIQSDRVNRRLGEMDSCQALFGGAGARQFDHVGRGVHTEDGARRTDQSSGDERDVAWAAPDIEHPHARPQSGEPQRVLGVVVVQPPLQEEPLHLHVGMSENVGATHRVAVLSVWVIKGAMCSLRHTTDWPENSGCVGCGCCCSRSNLSRRCIGTNPVNVKFQT